MKRKNLIIAAVVLMMALTTATASVCFADTGADAGKDAGFQGLKGESPSALDMQMDISKAQKSPALAKTIVKSIPVVKVAKGTESWHPVTAGYTKDNKISAYKAGIVQAVRLPKGTVGMYAQGTSASLAEGVYFGLYKDAACTKSVGTYSAIGSGYTTGSIVIDVPTAGTYYLGYYTDIYSYTPNFVNKFVIGVKYIDGSNRTLTSGVQTAVGNYYPSTKYFKFKAKTTGYVTLQGGGLSSYVTLLNSKKKAISSKDYVYTTSSTATNKYIRYGVKKGKTYYFKLKAFGNGSEGGYILKYTNVKVSEKSGSKRSKARKMAKKKSYKGTITAGSSRADWYKLKLGKRAKFTVTVKGVTNNKMSVAAYRSNGKKFVSGYFYRTNGGAKIWTYGKAPKGTYYIKISRGTKGSSGNYAISWK